MAHLITVGEMPKSTNINMPIVQKRPSSDMDILDIDEELKDDSFIFLEDKTHDDVSNILQQWKNNRMPLQTQQQEQQQQQQEYEQAYKLNSRTFTRPRRKSTQNIETLFSNTSYVSNAQHNQHQQNGIPILNLDIGGLVTPMHKSFLQDTSPPSSICSSMDGGMNSSLITSADFTNLNFLQSTQSIDFNNANNVFNLADKSTNDGYTLSDMIRDRKALESLTMSGESTLIKDSHIGQIDDISLTLSKTTSECSTMDNSTESVEGNNRTIELFNKNRTFYGRNHNIAKQSTEDALNKTVGLSEKMIDEMTFNLVENCMTSEHKENNMHALNVTHDICNGGDQQTSNETFKKPAALDETICLSGKVGNSTFDCTQVTPDAHCETPENTEKHQSALKFFESTPQHSNHKEHYTPLIKIVEDVNISPIVASSFTPKAPRTLNETYENVQSRRFKFNSDTFSGVLPQFESMEMIENIENPSDTFNKNFKRLEQSAAGIEMQNVMNLAQAEANLLAGSTDEEEFEHMLDEFGKVELNADQLKMKKSLETIKKRFNYGMAGEKNEREISREAKDMREFMHTTIDLGKVADENSISPENILNISSEPRMEDLRKLNGSMKNTMRDSRQKTLNSTSLLGSNDSAKEIRDLSSSDLTSSIASSGERLLTRRSRLYDDINLSTLSPQSCSSNHAGLNTAQGDENSDQPNINETGRNEITSEAEAEKQMKTDVILVADAMETVTTQVSNAAAYKLNEKRDKRDRDRFKTIKIVKERLDNGASENDAGHELNVPCIDDDDAVEQPISEPSYSESENTEVPQQIRRFSRRDQSTNVFNNNKSEVEKSVNSETTKTNTNYLTYKKPKESQLVTRNLPEAPSVGLAGMKSRLEPRSFSRPRYLSGLQKFGIVSKATSASDLEQTLHAPPRQLNLYQNTSRQEELAMKRKSVATTLGFNSTQQVTVSGNLKSPMGVKSKSFHNLSTNLIAPGMRGQTVPKLSTFGLRKNNSGSITIDQQPKATNVRTIPTTNQSSIAIQQQKVEDTLFKVPKLVSGIRAPAPGGVKRAGLMRPSSGYYSLNVTEKGATHALDIELSDAERHSSTNSMSSASSKISLQSMGTALKPLATVPTAEINITATLTKITTSSTGIPKPSGLKLPTSIKRSSGLPRPSSIVRR